MKIMVENNHSNAHVTKVDNYTTTYKPSQVFNKTVSDGFSLDIADKVMDDKAYLGHGLTTEDIMQQAQNTNAQAQKDFMIVMSNSVSGEDYKKLAENGFDPGSTDVETYVSILDKIKVTLAKAGVNIEGFTDNIDAETIEEITGSKIDANELIKKFEQYDIPVTKENVEQVAKAISKGESISDLSQDTIKYMVLNEKSPTIENLYLAQHKSAGELKQAKGYYSDNGYLAKKADNISWDNLNGQIEKIIKQSGLPVNEETTKQAKWLIESGIELNSKNMFCLTELNGIELPFGMDNLVDLTVCALSNGKQPARALVNGERPIDEQVGELIEKVNSISEDAIHEVVEAGETLNIKNLAEAEKNITDKKDTETYEASIKEIEARRQLEEIRLMMTEEASRKMLKVGINIDTTELSKLVEELRNTEESMKAALFMGKTVQENANLDKIYNNTLTAKECMKTMPAAVIGKVVALSENEVVSLTVIHEEGQKLQKTFEKANESYETLMTVPRKDLGDKISKAFRNIDEILTDMGLETSDKNRRAVRILGYNSMELTKENIDSIKKADSLVTNVIEKMTPKATLDLIREQKNPMEMSLEELDDYLSKKDRNPLDDSEKFSKYLQKLDKAGDITNQEKQAYIGIYRLFRQIEKTDGAAIGSLVATGSEMSFKNVLSAIRTSKKEVDIKVDEQFGALYDLVNKGEAIDKQINAGFSENHSEKQDAQKEKYYARLSGEIKNELADNTSIETLHKITGDQMENLKDMTLESFHEELLNNNEETKEDVVSKEKINEFRQETRQAASIEEEVIQSLIDYEQPVSVDNIQAAQMLLNERGQLFKKVFDEKEEESKDSIWEKTKNFVDGLTDEKSARDSYQEIIKEAISVVENTAYKRSTTSFDLKAVRSIYKGLNLAGNLSREENYEIPVEIGGEVTSVNLKIYHNSKKMGKVAVTMESEKLGKVACEMDVTKDRISGMVAFDDKQSQQMVEKLTDSLKSELEKVEGTLKKVQISVTNAKNLKLNNFGQDRELFEDNEKPSTRELYKTAKAFMTAISNVAA